MAGPSFAETSKKVLKLGILDELEEKAKHAGTGRLDNLFRFNKQTYQRLMKEGMHFDL